MTNSRTTTPWTSLPTIEAIYGKNIYPEIGYTGTKCIHRKWLNHTCRIRPRFTMIYTYALDHAEISLGNVGTTRSGVSGLYRSISMTWSFDIIPSSTQLVSDGGEIAGVFRSSTGKLVESSFARNWIPRLCTDNREEKRDCWSQDFIESTVGHW